MQSLLFGSFLLIPFQLISLFTAALSEDKIKEYFSIKE